MDQMRRILIISGIMLLTSACFHRKPIRFEVNFDMKSVKVLEENYIIDSISIYNHQRGYYYSIGLIDTSLGTNELSFWQLKDGYKVNGAPIDENDSIPLTMDVYAKKDRIQYRPYFGIDFNNTKTGILTVKENGEPFP
jgi:hypothetical protein